MLLLALPFARGEIGMPSETAAQDGSGAPEGVERILELLSDALSGIDALNLPSEIGARLQEVITAVEESAGK